MAERGKSFGVRIAENDGEGNGGEVKTKPIDKPGGGDEKDAIEEDEKEGGAGWNDAGGNFALNGSGVFFVNVAVEVPVESHGGAPGKDHAKDDEDKQPEVEAGAEGMGAEKKAEQGKRQGENGVAKLD